MSRSLSRWIAAILLLVGAFHPALGVAQVVTISFTDQDPAPRPPFLGSPNTDSSATGSSTTGSATPDTSTSGSTTAAPGANSRPANSRSKTSGPATTGTGKSNSRITRPPIPAADDENETEDAWPKAADSRDGEDYLTPMYGGEEYLPDMYGGEGDCFNGFNTCCYVPRNWVSADYLMWWTKGNHLPPLVSGAPTAVLPASAILFGDESIDDDRRSGFRTTIGHWSDPCGTVGWQATFFSVFDDDNSGDYANSTVGALAGGNPILGRPFFNNNPAINAPDAQLVSFPNVVAGAININSSSEMHSVSWNLRQHYRSGCKGRLDLLGGYRYFRFRDALRIKGDLVSTNPAGLNPVGTTIDIEDIFIAENDFHGGDLGFVAEFWHSGWSVEVLAKVALGNLRRAADITGSSVTTAPGLAPVRTAGGLLALPTNSGHHRQNDFAALPEFGINAKFEPRRNLTINVGYTLLMLNDISRTGELIDTTVNSTQLFGGALVGPASPASLFNNQTDFWAQGLNFGLTYMR